MRNRKVRWVVLYGNQRRVAASQSEVVYAVAERIRNQGYATQAVRTLVNYLLTQTDAVAVNAVALAVDMDLHAAIDEGNACQIL